MTTYLLIALGILFVTSIVCMIISIKRAPEMPDETENDPQ